MIDIMSETSELVFKFLEVFGIVAVIIGYMIWTFRNMAKHKNESHEIVSRYEPLILKAFNKKDLLDIKDKFIEETHDKKRKFLTVAHAYVSDVRELLTIIDTRLEMLDKLNK